MKRGRLIYSLATLLGLVAFPAAADDVAQRLESIVVETFDDPNTRVWLENGKEQKEDRVWMVTGSKFSTKEVVKDENGKPVEEVGADGKNTKKTTNYPLKTYADVWPAALFDTNSEKLTLRSLAIHSKFDRMGYNYIELYPAKKVKGSDGKESYVPSEIKLPGLVKMFDLWVWGSMFKYYIEAHFRDYRGVPYVIPMGNLWYAGWKNLKIDIPTSIPQQGSYLPRYKGISLTKLVIRTDPSEKVNDYYVYIDQIKVLTDMHQSSFDGRELIKPEVVKKIWSEDNSGAKTEDKGK